jgi:ATP-binding cassette subfamily B protein
MQALPLLMTFLGAFAMMTLIEPGIALLAAGLLPLYFFAMKLVGRRIRPLTRKWINSYSDMLSFVEENLGLLPASLALTDRILELKAGKITSRS